MVDFVLAMLAGMGAFFRSRSDLALEILALRQQVAVLKRKRPRPSVNLSDRLFWVLLRQFWSSWKSVLIIVKPDTVVGWHRAAFRRYWRWNLAGVDGGLGSSQRSANSSCVWRKKTPVGVLPKSMANC
jgi:hypothetical protein